jgi:hypothetical protein
MPAYRDPNRLEAHLRVQRSRQESEDESRLLSSFRKQQSRLECAAGSDVWAIIIVSIYLDTDALENS